MIRKLGLFCASLLLATPLWAADYQIDTKGQHAFIQFRIQHLGYSWLYGRFDDFDGTFAYDEAAPANSAVEVTINTASINSNHAERDKHLRSEDFLFVEKFPQAKFVSTEVKPGPDGSATITGNLTLRGVTRPVTIAAESIGGGQDPWGGYRQGFLGTTVLTLKDFGINFDLGPDATQVELTLSVEGVRQ
ncbi:YceI family protein [Aestuariirhabdus litorea]|uniref:YceI family protein n=1 Tax=Aestuariirhabdus litorea TaxID=2528527 RepID=A0A3P3VRG6_9GAMM|nr:YceI family protein [Aestuariirhabdus litorea]RRJ83403.1 YceI family protein [Aestuariirhabdus litorea]RWW93564.1 YceI family protein [Endozoicomonadaceae bacterium GTF-13]